MGGVTSNDTNSEATADATFNSVIGYGQTAMNASLLMNGLAANSLLSFVGSLMQAESPRPVSSWFLWSLILLATGTLLAAMTHGQAYLTQRSYAYRKGNADTRNNVAIGMTVGSYVLFFAAIVLFSLGVCSVPATSSNAAH